MRAQQQTESESDAPDARRELRRARTILVKIGTEIVHSPDGVLALGQIGGIIEQVRSLSLSLALL